MRIGLLADTEETARYVTKLLATLQNSIRNVIIIMDVIDLSFEDFGSIPWGEFDRALSGHRDLQKVSLNISDEGKEVDEELQQQLRETLENQFKDNKAVLNVSFTLPKSDDWSCIAYHIVPFPN